MKRLLFLLAVIFGLTFAATAKDTYAHDASVLPEAARTTISKNFKAAVSLVKVEKSLGQIKEYEVILTDGTEISFDRSGNWDNVETAKTKSVPSGLIPQGIRQYVDRNHKDLKIVGIDKERSGYDVELSNGIDIKFNKAGQFVRYDD